MSNGEVTAVSIREQAEHFFFNYEHSFTQRENQFLCDLISSLDLVIHNEGQDVSIDRHLLNKFVMLKRKVIQREHRR